MNRFHQLPKNLAERQDWQRVLGTEIAVIQASDLLIDASSHP